jgi:uncharacterized protein with PQ loop repeat
MPSARMGRFVILLQGLEVRDFSLTETVILALFVALGIAFVTWLLAGYYERRGGFGKK